MAAAERSDGERDSDVLERFGLSRDGDESWLGLARRAIAPTRSGDRLGVYELDGEIGRGAQGTVYRARQPVTQRIVAIKRLRAHVGDSERARERFEREIEVLTHLSHPNIVTVHAAEIVDGTPILVMEWIDGATLDRWANGDMPRSARETVALFAEVCDALAHAHRRGVLHCDLKPSNILVDREGRARVLDFGLARLVSRVDDAAPGSFVGTPTYAPPEQLEARWEQVDTRSDVYALGAVLFAALAGRVPFDDALEFEALGRAVRAGAVIGREELVRRAGPELEAVVTKAMALDREARYSSADELAHELRAWLAGEAVAAFDTRVTYRLRKWMGRHRLASALAIAACVLTLGFAIVATTLAVRLERRSVELQRALADATAASETAQRESKRHEAAAQFLENVIVQAGRVDNVDRDVRVEDVFAAAVRDLDRGALADQPAVEARIRTRLAGGYRSLGSMELAERRSRAAVDAARRPDAHDTAIVAYALERLAAVLDAVGKYAEAESAGREALAVREADAAKPEFERVATLIELGSVLDSQHRHEEALALHAQAAEITRRVRPEARGSLATAVRNIGLEELELGRLDDAERHTREALAIFDSISRNASDSSLRARRNLARVQAATGRIDEAIASMRAVLREWSTSYRGDLYSMDIESARLATMLVDAGELDEARQRFAAAIDGLDTRLDARHPLTVQVRLNFGRALTRRGLFSEAETVLRRACDGARSFAAGAERLRVECALALASALRAEERCDEALAVVDAAARELDEHPAVTAELGERCRADLAAERERCIRAQR